MNLRSQMVSRPLAWHIAVMERFIAGLPDIADPKRGHLQSATEMNGGGIRYLWLRTGYMNDSHSSGRGGVRRMWREWRTGTAL